MAPARRPRFYIGILLTGFLIGGFLAAFLKKMLPDSPAKEFFTYSVRPSFGPVPIDLLVVHFTLGPAGVEISLLSLIGVVLAYLLAKSLF